MQRRVKQGCLVGHAVRRTCGECEAAFSGIGVAERHFSIEQDAVGVPLFGGIGVP